MITKIILVIPSLKQGGAERILSLLANHWHLEGLNVKVVIYESSEQFYSLEPGIDLQDLSFKNNGQLSKFINIIKTTTRLRKILLQENPDAVLSFMIKSNLSVLVATLFTEIKPVISDRSNPYKKIPLFLNLSRKILYRYAGGIVAQTQLAKQVLEKQTQNKNIKVIPNPVRPIKSFLVKREKLIINIGRLVPEKGQKYLLEAFSKLYHSEWKLVILGDGPLRKELNSYAEYLGISNRVMMPGAVKNVDEWLSRSSIFAFSSISEGFPNALCEAMVAGLPIVSFNCDAGPSDIIKNGENGFLIPTINTEEFSKTIDSLIENPGLRTTLGEKASHIKNELEISKIAKDYLNLLKENSKK